MRSVMPTLAPDRRRSHASSRCAARSARDVVSTLTARAIDSLICAPSGSTIGQCARRRSLRSATASTWPSSCMRMHVLECEYEASARNHERGKRTTWLPPHRQLARRCQRGCDVVASTTLVARRMARTEGEAALQQPASRVFTLREVLTARHSPVAASTVARALSISPGATSSGSGPSSRRPSPPSRCAAPPASGSPGPRRAAAPGSRARHRTRPPGGSGARRPARG